MNINERKPERKKKAFGMFLFIAVKIIFALYNDWK